MSEDEYWNLFDLRRYSIQRKISPASLLDSFRITYDEPHEVTLEFLADDESDLKQSRIPKFEPINGVRERALFASATEHFCIAKQSEDALIKAKARNLFMISVYSQTFSDLILSYVPHDRGGLIHILENGGLEKPDMELPDLVRRNVFKTHSDTAGELIFKINCDEKCTLLSLPDVLHPYRVYDQAYQIAEEIWGSVDERFHQSIQDVCFLEGTDSADNLLPEMVKKSFNHWIESRGHDDPCFSVYDFLDIFNLPRPGYVRIEGNRLLQASMKAIQGDHSMDWRPNHALAAYTRHVLNIVEDMENKEKRLIIPSEKETGESRTLFIYRMLLNGLFEFGYQ